jgi:branched-chain amino acid transport system permease protein
MLGGLIIGLIETMWSGYVSVEYKDVAAFSVLIDCFNFLSNRFSWQTRY